MCGFALTVTVLSPQQMRVIGERRFAVFTPEHGEHFRFDLNGDVVRRLLPSNAQLVRFRQLPDQATAPMAHWLASAEVGELADAPPKLVCLADVDDFSVDPVSCERRRRDGGVFAFEPTARIFRQEGRWSAPGVGHDIEPPVAGIALLARASGNGSQPVNPSASSDALSNFILPSGQIRFRQS